MTDTKKCGKCSETKNLDEFYVNAVSLLGRSSCCKVCYQQYFINFRRKHPEYGKEYYIANKERITKRNQKRREELNEYGREYYRKNRERILQQKRKSTT